MTILKRGEEKIVIHDCREDVITMGRLDENIIMLNGNGVSRQHAKIEKDGDNFFLTDLKSGNGTYLNGKKIKANEKNLLQAGDTIAIDVFELKFGEESFDKLHEEITDSDVLEVKLLKKVITAFDKDMIPSIEVLNGSAEGKKIFLTDELGDLVIGRDPDCAFSINEHVISRRHAKITKRWGGIAIRDLESKNGTFLNNRRIVEEYLHDGDRIALGTIVMIFRNPQEINLAQIAEVAPRYKPANILPKDIPGIDASESATREEKSTSTTEPADFEESQSVKEWNKLEESLSGAEKYPEPKAKTAFLKRLTPMEIGMIGLGVLVIIFALITIVNLMAE